MDPSTTLDTYFTNTVKRHLQGIDVKVLNNLFSYVGSEDEKAKHFIKTVNSYPDKSTVWLHMYGRSREKTDKSDVLFKFNAYFSITGKGFRHMLKYIKSSIRILITIDAYFGGGIGDLKFLYNGTNSLNPYIGNPDSGDPRVYANVTVIAASAVYDTATRRTVGDLDYRIYLNTEGTNRYTHINGENDDDGDYNPILFPSNTTLFTYALITSFNYILNKTDRIPTVFQLYFEIIRFYTYCIKNTSDPISSIYPIRNDKYDLWPVIMSEHAVDLNQYILDIYDQDSIVPVISEGLVQASSITFVPNSYEDNDPNKTQIVCVDLPNFEAIRARRHDTGIEIAIINGPDIDLFKYFIYLESVSGSTYFLDETLLTALNKINTDNNLNYSITATDTAVFMPLLNEINQAAVLLINHVITVSIQVILNNICQQTHRYINNKLSLLKSTKPLWYESADVYVLNSFKMEKLVILSKIETVDGIQFVQFDHSVPRLTGQANMTGYQKIPYKSDTSSMSYSFITNNIDAEPYSLKNFPEFKLNIDLKEVILHSNNYVDVKNYIRTQVTDIDIFNITNQTYYNVQSTLEKASVLDTYVLPSDKVPTYNSGMKSMGWTVCDLNRYDEDIYYFYLLKVSLDTSEFVNKKIIKQLYMNCDLYPPLGAPFPLQIESLNEKLEYAPYKAPGPPPESELLYYHNARSNTLMQNSFYMSNIYNDQIIASSNTDLFLMALKHPTSNLFSPIESSSAEFRVSVTNMSNVFLDLKTGTEHFQDDLNFNIHMMARFSNEGNSLPATSEKYINNVKYSTTKYLDSELVKDIDFSKHVLKFHDGIFDENDPYFDDKNLPFENFSARKTDSVSFTDSTRSLSSTTVTQYEAVNPDNTPNLSTSIATFNESITTLIDSRYAILSEFDDLNRFLDQEVVTDTTQSAAAASWNKSVVMIKFVLNNVTLKDLITTITTTYLNDIYDLGYVRSQAIINILDTCANAESPATGVKKIAFVNTLNVLINKISLRFNDIKSATNFYTISTNFFTNTHIVQGLYFFMENLAKTISSSSSIDISSYTHSTSFTSEQLTSISERYETITHFISNYRIQKTFQTMPATIPNNAHLDNLETLFSTDFATAGDFLECYTHYTTDSPSLPSQSRPNDAIHFEENIVVKHTELYTSSTYNINHILRESTTYNLLFEYTKLSLQLSRTKLINFYKTLLYYNSIAYTPGTIYESNEGLIQAAIHEFEEQFTPPTDVYNLSSSGSQFTASVHTDVYSINIGLSSQRRSLDLSIDGILFTNTENTAYLAKQLTRMKTYVNNTNIPDSIENIRTVARNYRIVVEYFSQAVTQLVISDHTVKNTISVDYFNNYNYNKADSTAMRSNVETIIELFTSATQDDNINIDLTHLSVTELSGSVPISAVLTIINTINVNYFSDTGGPSTLKTLDDMYDDMQAIEKIARCSRAYHTVQIMKEAYSVRPNVDVGTNTYIASVFDPPGANQYDKPIKDFDFVMENPEELSLYNLSNLLYTPMATFSDLYSVKSNQHLFVSWTDDRNLFPIDSNQWKSPNYSNALLHIPLLKNAASPWLNISTKMKVNNIERTSSEEKAMLNVSNLDTISTNSELMDYLNELKESSGMVSENMSNTQRFQFSAPIEYENNAAANVSIHTPLSNITAESLQFPYYKCYTIPDSSSRDPVDLRVTFGGENIVFNSNSEMFWYDSDAYKSLLELRDTSNTLSMYAKTSTRSMFEKTKSNIFYIGGMPTGTGDINTIFDFESCENADILHMEQEIVTLCNLTYFGSNYSRVPALTAHEMFLSMKHTGFSNIVFNKSFDLGTDLYNDMRLAGSEHFVEYSFDPTTNDSNLYMWYSNTANQAMDFSFALSNNGNGGSSLDSYAYSDSRFFDKDTLINHIAIATNQENTARVRINADPSISGGSGWIDSNIFMQLTYPNTPPFLNQDQFIYPLYNSNDCFNFNLTSNLDAGYSPPYEYFSSENGQELTLTPFTLNTYVVEAVSSDPPFDYNFVKNIVTNSPCSLEYNDRSCVFRTYGLRFRYDLSSVEFNMKIKNLKGNNLKFAIKPIRNYIATLQVDQRVDVVNNELFVRFYNTVGVGGYSGVLNFSVCIETEFIPVSKKYVKLGELEVSCSSPLNPRATINTDYLESDTFPYATDLY
jgi:guanyl-specific ribonuclease Sa